MRRVVFYISDMGWGHATRSIVLIKQLKRELEDVEIIVRNRNALTLLSQESVKLAPPLLPQDPLLPKHYPFSREEAERSFILWFSQWENLVKEEVRFLKEQKASLVISDVVAQGIEAANILGIPGIIVSNLNWYDEYKYILGDKSELETLKEAYSHADWCFLLPLESENTAFRLKERVPLMAREFKADRVRAIRRQLLREFKPEIIALVTTGAHYRPHTMKNMLKAMEEASQKAHILWLVPKDFPETTLKTYRVPAHQYPDYIAASDFILLKHGYSTVSEAILSRTPMFLLYRSSVLEDCLATEELVLSGWAIRAPFDSEFSIPLQELFCIERSPLSKRMENKGAEAIVNRLRERFL